MKNAFWNINATTDKSAELTLYGPISSRTWYGDEVTPKKFSDDLKALGEVQDITVRINSGGGDVFAGIAIYNMLKSHEAKIIVRIEGLPASIASIIAMSGDEIIMPTGSMMMIHNPMAAPGYSTAPELRDLADALDRIRDSLLDVYTENTSNPRNEVGLLMDEETWMTASEAFQKGFATQVSSEQIAASVFNGVTFDLSMFKNAPASTLMVAATFPSTEEERISNLESIRTSENSDFIDQAIQNGTTPEQAALKIIKRRTQYNMAIEQSFNGDQLSYVLAQHLDKRLRDSVSVSDSNSLVEGLTAAINKDRSVD